MINITNFRVIIRVILILILTSFFFTINAAHDSDVLFDDTQVLEFHFTFEHDNFWDTLEQNYNNGSGAYLKADLEFNGEICEMVGVKLTGNTSMSYPSQKKSMKVKFDAFTEDQDFYGVNKLNLKNAFKDPSFLREKLLCDHINEFIPGPRTSFVKVYLNGIYWGLYNNVEQVNMKFIDKNFGNNEGGNLFKGDPEGDLVWYGDNENAYFDRYYLKTNEEEPDWSDLVYLIDKINNTPLEVFPTELERIFHIRNFLFFSAINNFFVNLDSYIDKGHNYYIYHREDTGKFVHIPWDFNFALGTYKPFLYPQSQLPYLPVFWESAMPLERPLVNRMFQVEEYRQIYLSDYQYLMDNVFQEELLFSRIDSLVNMIRPAVYADTLKMFTNEEFEQSILEDIPYGNSYIFGIKSFLQTRIESINEQLLEFNIPNRISGLYINEFLANNVTDIQDEFNENEDWIEIYNDNDFPVNLNGFFLSDDPSIPDKWKLNNIVIPGNGYELFWADNNPEQGNKHTNFCLDTDGETIGLYCLDGVIPADKYVYDQQQTDVSFGRLPDGGKNWQFFPETTPLNPNYYITIEELFINEFMASNESCIADEYEEFDDWLELYNGNDYDLDLTGMYLTDDPEEPDKWEFPAISIPADGHLLIWADDDTEQGELHTNFKLSADGEYILLYDHDTITLIDSICFAEQQPDVSFGRTSDGFEEWSYFSEPSPGTSNSETSIIEDQYSIPDNSILIGNYPNPFICETKISYFIDQQKKVQVSIYNAKGQLINKLIDNVVDAGFHLITWNGKDRTGKNVSSGVYFYKLNTSKSVSIKKMILMQ